MNKGLMEKIIITFYRTGGNCECMIWEGHEMDGLGEVS